MEKAIKLSVLDQSPIRKGGNARQAIVETTQLAQLADQLGYTRFWVSEHHNISGLAGSTPEVLLAHLGSHTRQIRLGSGGIMLPNHSALKVAENFRMLETLFPGRIDLGIGRAPGGDRLTSAMLNPSNTFSEESFLQQLVDLKHYLNDTATFGESAKSVKAIPLSETQPDLWMLTSSGQSGLVAAYLGMGVSFAHFINPNGGPEAVAAYKAQFRPSEQLDEPQASLAIFVLCAETEEKVHRLQATMDYLMLRTEMGISEGTVSYEMIENHHYSAAELARIRYNRQRVVSGTPLEVKMQLRELAEEYGVEEIVAATITYTFADRVRSYELLAEAFELQPTLNTPLRQSSSANNSF